MEINKQLFEDVLSGKLKGTFVLRENNRKINSEKLERNDFFYSHTHPYRLLSATYNSNGKTSLYDYEMSNDIIDFISDTNMKKNELTIEIPDGKIVDWEESKKQNKIVLKDKQLTYKDVCKELFEGKDIFYICTNDECNATTEHQLECILAKNKLANVALYLNDGWKPNFSNSLRVFVIYNEDGTKLKVDSENSLYAKDMGHIVFKTEKLAEYAIEILGEETVKLALEPLGI